jgi:NAD-dependent deacetylase
MRRFYGERFKQYKNCRPHAGHYALAKLEEQFHVTHVTQNIDGLLEEAGCTDVKHVHGKINFKKCERHKDITTLGGESEFTCDYKAVVENSDSLDLWGGKCPLCDGELRPDVVWFNEAVHLDFEEMKDWVRTVKYEDGVFICAGTSVQVYPAGYLLSFFSQVKEKYIVDMNPKPVADYVLLEGKASDLLPALVEKLML